MVDRFCGGFGGAGIHPDLEVVGKGHSLACFDEESMQYFAQEFCDEDVNWVWVQALKKHGLKLWLQTMPPLVPRRMRIFYRLRVVEDSCNAGAACRRRLR